MNGEFPLLDTMVNKDKDNNPQTTLYQKPTDQQSYLHAKSEHPRALKNGIAYIQTLRVKTVCSTNDEYQRDFTIKKKTLERKYNEDNLNKQMEKVDLIKRKELLQNNEKTNRGRNIPLVLTYNRTRPNIPDVVRKNLHIPQINPEFRNVFVNKSPMAFKRIKIRKNL